MSGHDPFFPKNGNPEETLLPKRDIEPPPPPKFGMEQRISPQAEAGEEDLAKIFNTAIISTQSQSVQNLSNQLMMLNQSPAFQAILHGVKKLADEQGLSFKQAAESVIETFRKVDGIWKDYVFLEGIEKIRRG